MLGKSVDGFLMIIDVGDMTMNKVTREFLWLVQRIAEVDQKHYPERLGAMFIINAPGVFPLVWKGIKPWLDVRTTNKIKVHSKREQWEPALLEVIDDPSQLPVEYGGTGPALISHARDKPLPLSELKLEERKAMEASRFSRLTGTDKMKGPRVNQSEQEEDQYEDAIMLDIDLYTSDLGQRTLDEGYLRHMMLQMEAWNAGSPSHYALTVPELQEKSPKEIQLVDPDMTPQENGADGPVMERQLWSDQLAAFLNRAPILCGPCQRAVGWDIERLQRNIERANLVCLSFGVMTVAFGVDVLASMSWFSDLVIISMWLSVVIVCTGCVQMLMAFVGYLSSRYANRTVLNLYSFAVLPISLFLLILAFVCFAASSPRNSSLFRATWLRIEEAMPSHVNLEGIRSSIQHYNIMLGAGCLCVASANFYPSLLGMLLSYKLKHRRQPIYADANHLRVVTRVASAVTLAFGVGCIAYGSYATVRVFFSIVVNT